MEAFSLGVIEAKFAALIWENEPLSSGELSRLAETALGWKKTTSFTVLKRLTAKGLFQNNGGTVTSLISKAEFDTLQSEKFVEKAFSGSLPAFLAAFSKGKRLTMEEVAALREMVETYDTSGTADKRKETDG